MTLNLAHGRHLGPHQALQTGALFRDNLEQVASTLRNIEPDLVALQEADGPSSWSGNFCHVSHLGEEAGLPTHYRGRHHRVSLGRLSLDSGTALMARLPLLEPSSHRFEQSWRDTKGFVAARLPAGEHGEREIDVASIHLDFLAPAIRRRQISRLVEVLADRGRPLVLLGDFNTLRRDRREIQLLCRELGLRAHKPESSAPTFPVSRPLRRLDWILASPELEFHSYVTVPTPMSDHLAVVADLKLREQAS